MDTLDRERKALEALESIGYIKGAHSLRSFRRKIFFRSKLSYKDSFIALKTLKDRGIIVRNAHSNYKYINSKAKRHKSFNEFIASIADSDFVTEELRENLKKIGVHTKSNYAFLKELTEQVIYKERGCKVKDLQFKETDEKGLYLENFPLFGYNYLKNSVYKKIARLKIRIGDKSLLEFLSSKQNLYLGYPFYSSKEGSLIPIFFIPVTVGFIEQDEFTISTYDDYYFLNSKFVEEFALLGDKTKLKNFLNIFASLIDKRDLVDSHLSENLALDGKQYPLEDLLRYVALNFDSEFQLSFNPKKLKLKEENKISNVFVDSAIIFEASQNSKYLNYLNQILVADDESLNKTSLHVFSNEIVDDDNDAMYCLENLVVGEDICKFTPKDSALRALLYSALDNSNSLCIVKSDLNLDDVINKILLNYALSDTDGSFAYAFNGGIYKYKQHFISKDELNLLMQKLELDNYSMWEKFIDYQKIQIADSKFPLQKSFINKLEKNSNEELFKVIFDLNKILSVLNKQKYQKFFTNSLSLLFSKLALKRDFRSSVFNCNDIESCLKNAQIIYGFLYLELAKRQLLVLKKEFLSSFNEEPNDEVAFFSRLDDVYKNINNLLEKGFSHIYKLEESLVEDEFFSKSIIYLDKDFSLAKLLSMMLQSKQVIFIAQDNLCEPQSKEFLLPSTYELIDSLCLDDENSILKNDLTSSKSLSDEQSLFEKFIFLFKEARIDVSFNQDLNLFEISKDDKKLLLTLDFDFEDVKSNDFRLYISEYLKSFKFSLLRIDRCYLENDIESYVQILIEDYFSN